MKSADLIQVLDCSIVDNEFVRMSCGCFLCADNSNRIGLVLKRSEWKKHRWTVLFDIGPGWVMDNTPDMVVVS